MGRHRGGDNDGGYGEGVWLPGGHGTRADDDQRGAAGTFADPYQITRTSPAQEAHTGPPWDEAGAPWDEARESWDGPRESWDGPGESWDGAAEPWAGAGEPWSGTRESWDGDREPGPEGGQPWQPDGPGLRGTADLGPGHPSGPLPPVRPPAEAWPEPPAAGYPGTDYPGPDYPGPDYPGGSYGGYPGEETAYLAREAAHPGTETAYPGDEAAGYLRGDGGGYGGYPDAGYDDQTYVHPVYTDAGFTGRDEGYPEDGGYLHADGDGYAGPLASRHGDRDYPDHGDWYGDVDEDQDWVDEDGDADGDFLPGLAGGTGRADSGPDGRPPRGSGRSRPPGKRKSRMRRIAQWLALSVVVLLLAAAGAAYYYVNHYYLHPPDYSGSGAGWVTVRIYPGDSAATVGQRLQQAGVVETARAFQNAAKASGQGSALEPGYYRVHQHMAAALAFAMLLKPSSRIQTKITIPEGQRLSQIIAELGQATGNPAGYQQAIKDVPALGLPSYAKGNPEGYLFPATYDIQPNTPPVKVLKAMVARFGVEAASVNLPAAAAHAQLTEGEAIVVASLIQAEGRNPADFPKIAEVIYNRLNSGVKLQLDSTVMYALHTYGIRATSAQARVRSPYNTYLRTGLPPGPIDSPGDVAIQAALHPAHGNLLYFVTVDPKTGLTKFTSSYTVAQQYEAELSANLAKGQ